MRTTIDLAGRVVIPKQLRDQIGLTAGEVEVLVDATSIRIRPIAGENLEERSGRLVIPPSSVEVDDDLVRGLRDADQR